MVSSLGSSEGYSDGPLAGSRLGEPHLAARVLYRKQLFWTFRILENDGPRRLGVLNWVADSAPIIHSLGGRLNTDEGGHGR